MKQRHTSVRVLKTTFIVLSIVLIFLVIFLALNLKAKSEIKLKAEERELKTEKAACIIKTENRTVRGNSLSGLIELDSTVRILFGYYVCNEIRRGDVIAYSYSGNSNPIIKIVMGLPGDRFGLQKTEGGWNIMINGVAAKNSQNQTYILDEKGYQMLSLYEDNYHGVIPPNTYLILGNLTVGSIDSSRFGLVDKSDILGKVEY